MASDPMLKIHSNRLALLFALPVTALAGTADVMDVKVRCASTCSFDVTVKHADTGWDHYANKWEVVAPSGDILGTRTLFHPHVDEQPFTRSLSGVAVPPDVTEVIVRAYDSVHEGGGREVRVDIPK